MTIKMPSAKVRKMVAELAAQVPAGWTVETGDGCYGMDDDPYPSPGHAYVKFEKTVDDVRAAVALNVVGGKLDSWQKQEAYKGMSVTGHTFVNHGCFTRRGIDCESVMLVSAADRVGDHAYADVATMLAGEWKRCAEVVEARKTAESVPGTPFTRQPAWFVEASAKLKAGKSVSLSPHGFGTGYTLSRRRHYNYSQRAPLALEQKLGVSPIYLDTFDAD